MTAFATLPLGTPVIATTDFGPVIRGQFGMVTGHAGSWLPWRRVYACSFLGGVHVTARRTDLAPCEHGISRDLLEDALWFLHTGSARARQCHLAVELRRPPVDPHTAAPP